MTVVETVQNALGSGTGDKPKKQQRKNGQSQPASQQIQISLANSTRESPLPLATATREQMSEARLPVRYRDSCAGLLIPLNRCRFEEYYLPWKCETERHSYEKCQYEEFKSRVAKMDELRAARGGERSN